MNDSNVVLLEAKNLTVTFSGVKAVNDVSIKLRAGIVTTLVGPNGAGKTTLFNALTGHLRPDCGEVVWKGAELNGTKHFQVARKGIARTFQDLRLFSHMTVEDNIRTAMEPKAWLWQRSADKERTERILEQTGLQSLRNVRAIDLAYAERKFLSMARIMALDASLWLLDEPASGLDRRSYERFIALLKASAAKGITVCIIEHNLDIVSAISDRVAFLDRGQLLAEGEPGEVMNNPALAAIYFGDRTE